jgi:serine/threonine protein kinase/WD40 repeat protein
LGLLPLSDFRQQGVLPVSAPPSIPDHTLRRPIGRGAYGEVWLARNVMGAPRAVKIVWRRQFESDRPYEREFAGIQRYEPVSRSADGLVHVLHVGRNNASGYFYYVMELADSAVPLVEEALESSAESTVASVDHTPLQAYTPRTLRSDLKRLGRLPVADCLRLALDVVGGLARLHERGLVHRDVKPGNIIFVEGRAKLADIGLVSKGGEGRTFVGTEGYIPPEGPGSAAADLYALGMVLYEAITGYTPEQFPKVPPEWFAEEAAPESLEFHEVVLKACEAAKERRYQTAEEMQADLALLQSGQSVRHLRALEKRVSRWRRIGWAAALSVALAVTTALVANWRARVADESRTKETQLREHAQKSLVRAENAERESRQQLNAALFEQARALVVSKELGHRTRAIEALRRAAGATNAAELRRVAFAALALPDLRLEREISLDPALTLFHPDPGFKRVALGSGRGPVTICSLPDLEVLATLPASTNRDAYVAVWSADSRFVAVKRQHDNVGVRCDWEVWNVGRTQRVVTAGPNAARDSATFHPRRPLFMAGYGGGRVTEWNLEDGREVRTFIFPNTPHTLVYSPGGERLAASYRRGSNWVVAFHDATNLEALRVVESPESIEWLAWHPQGRWVTGSCLDASPWARGVWLIEADTGTVTTLGEHKIKTAVSRFTADGDYLVSGGWDREIICWDLRTLQRAFTYAARGYWHFWSANGRRCAVVLPDNVAQFFAFERPNCRSLSGNPGNALYGGQFSPDGRWLVVRDDRQLCLWDLSGTTPAALVPVSAPPKTSAFFSPDSQELFVAIAEEYIQSGYLGRWRLGPGTNANAPPQLEPLPVQFPNGLAKAAVTSNELVMTSREGVRFVALTNLESGEGRVMNVPLGMVYVSPDAQWLAMTYGYSPVVGVYRLPAMEEVARLQTSNLVGSIAFSPTADEMLVLNRSGAEWFDTATWRCTRRQPTRPVSGSYALYTPDGKGIWMVTHFRNAALLDRHTLEPVLPLPNDVLPLALSPDGRQLAVSVEGRRVQLWDMGAFRQELAKLGLDW